MIEEHYPNPKPKKPVWTAPITNPPFYTNEAKEFGIDIVEYRRRQGRIAHLANTAGFYTGVTVFPATEEGMEIYGPCKVVGIVRQYKEMGKDYEWPESDNPMIVLAISTKTQDTFNATTNYFTTKNPAHVC